MKRLFILPLLIVFLFTGCAGWQLTETQDAAVTKLARIAGITLALEKPGEIDKALAYIKYVEGIKDGKLKERALALAIEYAYKEYGKTNKTVIIVAEVVDLLKIIIPEGTGDITIPPENIELLNKAIAGFKEGLELAK